MLEPMQNLIAKMYGGNETTVRNIEKLINTLVNASTEKNGLSSAEIQRHESNLINRFHELFPTEQAKYKNIEELLDHVANREGNFNFKEISDIIKSVQINVNRELLLKQPDYKDLVYTIESIDAEKTIHQKSRSLIQIADEYGQVLNGEIKNSFKEALLQSEQKGAKIVEEWIRNNKEFNEIKKKEIWEKFTKTDGAVLINQFANQVVGTELSSKGATNNVLTVNSNKITKSHSTDKYLKKQGIRYATLSETVTLVDRTGKKRNVNLSTYNDVAAIQENISKAVRESLLATDAAKQLAFTNFTENELANFHNNVSGDKFLNEGVAYIRLSAKDKLLVSTDSENLKAIEKNFNEFYDNFLLREFSTDSKTQQKIVDTFRTYTKNIKEGKLDTRSMIELKVLMPYLDHTGKRSELIKLFTELSKEGVDQSALYKIQANIFKRGNLSDGGTTTPLSLESNNFLAEYSDFSIVKEFAKKIKDNNGKLNIQVIDDASSETNTEHLLNNRKVVSKNYDDIISNNPKNQPLRQILRETKKELAELPSLESSSLDGIKYASEPLMAYIMASKGEFKLCQLEMKQF